MSRLAKIHLAEDAPVNPSISTFPRPRLALVAGGLAATMLVGTAGLAMAQTPPPEPPPTIIVSDQQTPSIIVTGVGRVFVRPDVADVTLGVVVQRDTAQEAATEAANDMTAVIEALIALGIDEADIQTTQLSLNPVYDWNLNPPRIMAWEANNLVRVTLRDVEQVGPAVDAAIAAGATSVQGVNFRVDDPTVAEAEGRRAAVADARAKADLLAAEAGVTIVGVIGITEVSANMPPPIYFDRMMAAEGAAMDAASTPVLVGESELQVSVNVTFEIE
jgi:uncharacterized protein